LSTIFFTGFPGFLGVELLPRMLRRSPDATATCLVQGKFAPLARQRVDEIVAKDPSLAHRIILVEGDITVDGSVSTTRPRSPPTPPSCGTSPRSTT